MHNPPVNGPIPWDQAPEGTTHAYRSDVQTYWMKLKQNRWFYWSTIERGWKIDPVPNPIHHTARPSATAPAHPPGATHIHIATGRAFKAGPNAHARLWGTYNNCPAWICASSTKNESLNDPECFTPINPQQSTPDTELFTMSAEQAKALALENRPMKVVEVRFQRAEGAKAYHYYAPADAKTGDYAVVYASDNIVTGRDFPFTVVQITKDEVIDTQRATKAILGTFNEDFAKHVQARIEHMARVKAKLQTKKKQFEESAFFEMLAKSDPEAAALLDELKSFRM